uniref:Uncharacterized protein n=1 Tax=Bionectria ochroleuca TaxID=29856 RepID=A0A8H7K283_BIOOC
MAHQEPTIWHMVVAIGALDEHQTVDTSETLTFALEQYRIAIKSLLRLSRVLDKGPRLDLYLIASILFTCFENIQGHHHAAGMHIIGGSKLMVEVGSDKHIDRKQQEILGRHFNMGAYINSEDFIPFFASLNDDVAMMAYQDKSEEYQNFLSQSDNREKALSFKSIAAAKSLFDYGRCLFISERSAQASGQLQAEHITATHDRVARLTGLLARFSIGLDALVERKTPNLTMRDQISVTVLRLHILYAQLTLRISTPASIPECQDDILLSRMRHMVELGQNIVIYLSANLSPGATSFCLDMGYVIPLFTVASQCPDRSLRWEAIRILRFLPRQEGLWSSLLVARAAERIMAIEDSLGLQLRGCVGKLTDSRLGVAPSVFEIDSNGGRLQYISPQGTNRVSSIVVEELFSW